MTDTIGIVAVVTVYHPDKQLLKRSILSMKETVDRIILWRNSNEDLTEIESLSPKIILMGSGQNEFIASPFNRVLEWCKAHGYKYLLTMDQDSVWENLYGFVRKVLDIKSEDIAIVAPNINNDFNKEADIVEPETVITSGSLIDVDVALKIGGFNEKYQIYWVDGEFCYKARLNGYKIKMLTRFRLIHKFGEQKRTLFGFKTSNYSPIVYYYMIRNMLWEHRQYGNKAVSNRCIAYTLFYIVRGIILGEKNKFRKLYGIGTGIKHGLFKSYR